MSKKMKLRLGAGAEAKLLIKKLKPSLLVASRFNNVADNHIVEEFLVLRLEERIISRKLQLAAILRHDIFGDEEVYCLPRFVHVTKEGPEDQLFISYGRGQYRQTAPSGPEIVENAAVEVPQIFQDPDRYLRPDAIANDVAGLPLTIDDDTLPAPENVPVANQNDNGCVLLPIGDDDNVCQRRMNGVLNRNPRLIGLPKDSIHLSRMQMFELLFPIDFVKNNMIPEMNKKLGDAVGKEISYGEFLQFVGIILKISSVIGPDRHDFWNTTSDIAPFKFNDIMSKHRFDSILHSLAFTDREAPAYNDKFWEVRDIIDAWNDNMKKVYLPGWINDLDESMSKWIEQFTCPGFMIVPRKPWPCGNEYHTIVDNTSDVLFALELVEGKDSPPQAVPKKYAEKGKTVSLVLRLTESLSGTGAIVTMDSGF